MDAINELEVRKMLQGGLAADQLTTAIIKHILDESLSWEEKRPFWHLLLLSGRDATLCHALSQCLKAKLRIPFDLLIQLSAKSFLKPQPIVVKALLKGVQKQNAEEELIGPTGWDRFSSKIGEIRDELLDKVFKEQAQFKDNLVEKFEFLQNQRMGEQAARVLRRMVELYPDETRFAKLKKDFDEQWARDVVANHMAGHNLDKLDRTLTTPSTTDQEMLNCFFKEGESISFENREFAADLAICFWFMEDFTHGLEMIAWAPPSLANDWLKVELLFSARRFIEALELLNHLELKYINDPDTSFAVSFLRAKCLKASGQETAALEILQSIVRVRPNYRSVNALLQEWTEGATWD